MNTQNLARTARVAYLQAVESRLFIQCSLCNEEHDYHTYEHCPVIRASYNEWLQAYKNFCR